MMSPTHLFVIIRLGARNWSGVLKKMLTHRCFAICRLRNINFPPYVIIRRLVLFWSLSFQYNDRKQILHDIQIISFLLVLAKLDWKRSFFSKVHCQSICLSGLCWPSITKCGHSVTLTAARCSSKELILLLFSDQFWSLPARGLILFNYPMFSIHKFYLSLTV